EEPGCLVLLPAHLGELPVLLGGQIILDVQIRAEITEQQVELAVSVVVGHGDLRADARTRFPTGLQEFAVADPGVLGDQGDRDFESGLAAPADIAVPVHATVTGTGEEIPESVAVPVGDHWVGMLAAGHAERFAADLDPLVAGGVGGPGATPL